MKRDFDLIREILSQVEMKDRGFSSNDVEAKGYSEQQVAYHLVLLLEAGLIVGAAYADPLRSINRVRVERLTWDGHEFLSAARSNDVWAKAKLQATKLGGVSLEVMKGILVQVGKSVALDELGLKG